jgi:hypothetical protein
MCPPSPPPTKDLGKNKTNVSPILKNLISWKEENITSDLEGGGV